MLLGRTKHWTGGAACVRGAISFEGVRSAAARLQDLRIVVACRDSSQGLEARLLVLACLVCFVVQFSHQPLLHRLLLPFPCPGFGDLALLWGGWVDEWSDAFQLHGWRFLRAVGLAV